MDIAGAGLSTTYSIACSGSAYSQAVTFTAGEGAKAITVTQTDNASNVTQVTTSLINDTIAPVITITSPAVNFNTQGSITLTGACETGLNIVFSGDINAQAPVACSGGAYSQALTLSGADGTKNVVVTQTDAAGNSASDNRNFIKDTVAPVITQTTLSDPYYSNTNSITFGGSCESGYSVTIKLGASTESSVACMASTWSYAVASQTSDATYNYTFIQTDAAGNSASATGQWIRDTVAPTLTISPASYITFGNSVTFSGTCEFGIGATIFITGADTTTTTCNMGGIWSYTVAAQTTNATRNYNFSYTDQAGNNTTVAGSWQRNLVAPVLTLTDSTNTIPANQNTYAKTTSISVSVSAVAGAVGWCLSETQTTQPTAATCNGGTWVGTSPTSFTLSTPDGAKTVYVWIKDSLDQVSSLGDSKGMTLDRVAPSLAYTSPNAGTSHNATITLAGTCETGITVYITGTGVSGAPTATCSGGSFSQAVTFSAGEGSKSIDITQTDNASNSTTVNRSFINDTIAPNLTIATPAANTSAQSSVTLTGACETGLNIQFAGDLLSTLNVACSGGAYSQTVFFSAGDGNKTVTATQVDAASNTTNVSRTFIRDNVAPVITQTNLSYPYYSNTNTVTFGGVCETGLTVTIKKAGVTENTTTCTASTWAYAVATQTTDATRNYSFEQTDGAGNLGSTTGQWIRDTVAPTLTFTSSSSFLTASNTVTFTGNCEAGLPSPIAVSGTDTNTTACSSGSWSYTVATKTTDNTRNYNFTLTDQAGNATTINGTWERNTNVPNLTITSSTRVVNTANSTTFSGGCETGLNIEIRLGGVLENTITCPAGTYSYTVATQTTDGSRSYELRQTNALLLSTNVNGTWIRDTTAPMFTANQMDINENAVETNVARVEVDLQAVDATTNITHFCLKLNNTAPTGGDSCFIAVDAPSVGLTPALTLNLVNYQFNVPIVPDTYTIYGWAKDEAGNVSSLTAAGTGTALQDKDEINFVVYNPPTITSVVIGSNDNPADPPSSGDLTIGAGQPIYIKWTASDDKPLGSNPITILFTTDDQTYSTVATNLVNGQNGSCSVDSGLTTADDGSTGCYYWSSSPVSGYLRVRVVVQDSDGLTAGFSSVPMNVASSIRFLAGNTDPGTNLSAQAAIFLSVRLENIISQDSHSLVVTRDGTVFFKDMNRGILKVDPSDGVQRLFIPQTGTSSGDGGPATNATIRLGYKIALDSNYPTQRLWIYDYNRIRRVDLATGIIDTIIGGGTDNNDTVASPLNVKTDYPASDPDGWRHMIPFLILPSGDVIFQGGNDGYYDTKYSGSYRVKHYHADTGQTTSFRVTSITSTSQHASGTDLIDCHTRGVGFRYDKATSTITDRLLNIRFHPYWGGGECSTFGDQGGFVSVDASGVGAGAGMHPPRITTYMERHALYTGLDGELYAYSRYAPNGLWKFIPGSPGSWTQLLGHADGQAGQCDDFTDALSCHTYIHDVFVQEDGTVYFLDYGRIRTITPANKVVTLMGQGVTSGVGGSALAARLGTGLRHFQLRNDGGMTLSSTTDSKFYEFMPDGSFYHIAGNGLYGGAVTNGVDARTQPVNLEWPASSGDKFGVDPATGDLDHHNGDYQVRRLKRDTASVGSTGAWEDFLGNTGSLNWADPSADGTTNYNFNADCATFGYNSGTMMTPTCWYGPIIQGFFSNKILIHKDDFARDQTTSNWLLRDKMLKIYDATTKVQTHLVGINDPISTGRYDNVCADGDLLSTCEYISSYAYRTLPAQYDSVNNAWMTARADWARVYYMIPGGNMLYINTDQPVHAFAYRRNASDEYIYYCSNTTRQIRRRHINSGTEIALSWPITSIKCDMGSMHWSTTRNSLIFVYEQNGLNGIAEYLDP